METKTLTSLTDAEVAQRTLDKICKEREARFLGEVEKVIVEIVCTTKEEVFTLAMRILDIAKQEL